jgi:hypothetical protein
LIGAPAHLYLAIFDFYLAIFSHVSRALFIADSAVNSVNQSYKHDGSQLSGGI